MNSQHDAVSQRILSMTDLLRLDEDAWMPIKKGNIRGAVGSSNYLGDNDIAVAFKKNNKGAVNRVKIRIGCGLIKNLGWKAKDSIVPLNSKDDVLAFRLIKSEAGSGYSLTKEPGSRHFHVTFKWKLAFALPEMASTIVEHYCPRDEYVIFSARSPKKARPNVTN